MAQVSLSDVAWIPVVISVIASMVIGFVWYSKALFSTQWMKLIGKSEKELKDSAGPGYVVALVCGAVEAVVLSLLIHVFGAATPMEGATVGFLIWVGFIGPTSLLSHIFQKRSLNLWAIDYGNQLVVVVVMGAIIAGWPK